MFSRFICANRFYSLAFLCLFLTSLSVTATPTLIQKSPLDKREYSYIQLSNGLKVMVVSDKAAKTTAAALVVNAGSYDEPSEHLGLAHYLEHMLFLGTKKFPKPDEFQQFVSQYGGGYNATTKGEQTAFFFHIQPEFIEPALERFSDFFIAPLFNVELMDRELHSVDAEFHLNVNQGSYALHEVDKQTSNYAHPFSRFSAGNVKTLNQKEKLYPAVKAFFKKYYHANNMTLALVGPQSKSELEKLAKRYFSDITSGQNIVQQRPMVYEAQHLGQDIQMRSKSQAKELLIQFYIPSQQKFYKEKPGQLVAMLLGYEGKGALAYELKKKGWVTSLSSQYGAITKEQDAMTLHCILTEQGIRHVDDITQMVFAYIRLMQAKGIPEHFYNEVKAISHWSFQYSFVDEPIDYALNLAENLPDVPARDILTSGYYMKTQALPQKEVSFLLSQLQPQLMRRTLLTTKVKTEHTTKWYQGSYNKKKLTANQIKRFSSPVVDAHFTLPQPNVFLPEKLTLLQQTTDVKAKPQKFEMDGISLWFHQNTEYNIPRSNVIVNIELKDAFLTPKNALLAELFVQSIEDELQEKLYPVFFAGGNVSFQAHPRGISLYLSSYSDKQQVVLEQVLQTIAKMDLSKSAFKKLLSRRILNLQGYQQQALFQQAISDLNTLLYVPTWHPEELLKASKEITYHDFQRFSHSFWQAGKLDMLVHGNVKKKTATQLVDTLKPYFPNHKQGISQAVLDKVVKLDNHKTWYRPITSVDENQVLVWYLQHPQADYPTMAKMVLFSKLLESPYFQRLRVEKQLAYALQVTPHVLNKVSGLVFWIQSTNATPEKLQQEIQQFVTDYRQSMQGMTEENIAPFRNAVVSQLRQMPQTLDEETQRWWSPIQRGDYEFDRPLALSQAVEKVTLPELIAFADELFAKEQGTGQLMIISSTKKPIPKDQLVASMSALKDKSSFL
jgi:secreted Zn-dependent insulinase-like peptidase